MVEMTAVVQPGDGQALQRQADHQRTQGASQDAQPQRTRMVQGHRPDVGAHHVEGAVGEVHKTHDAKDQRQAGSQQKKQHAILRAIEEQCQ